MTGFLNSLQRSFCEVFFRIAAELMKNVIRVYWTVVPVSRRRRCIYKESCSNAVYRAICADGGRVGIDILRERARRCRPGYALHLSDEDQVEIVLVDGSVLHISDASSSIAESAWRIQQVVCMQRDGISRQSVDGTDGTRLVPS